MALINQNITKKNEKKRKDKRSKWWEITKVNKKIGKKFEKEFSKFLFSRSTGNEPKVAGSEGGNDERKMEETSVYSGLCKTSLSV